MERAAFENDEFISLIEQRMQAVDENEAAAFAIRPRPLIDRRCAIDGAAARGCDAGIRREIGNAGPGVAIGGIDFNHLTKAGDCIFSPAEMSVKLSERNAEIKPGRLALDHTNEDLLRLAVTSQIGRDMRKRNSRCEIVRLLAKDGFKCLRGGNVVSRMGLLLAQGEFRVGRCHEIPVPGAPSQVDLDRPVAPTGRARIARAAPGIELTMVSGFTWISS